MINMDLLHRLDELLDKELKKVVEKGEIQPNEWPNLKALACIMKDVKEVEQMLYEWDDSYSSRSYNPRMAHDYRVPYDHYMDGVSEMRGRSKVTGRYMSRSRNDGRSGHSIRDRAVDAIERMYDEATTDHERNVLDDMIRMIESSERS